MSITLAEAAKLSNDIVLQGVIETILYEDPLASVLPFIPIVGNAITYNRENAAAGAQWYDTQETWQEGTPTFTQVQAVLRIAGGDADLDNFLKRTRSNVQDLEAAVLQLKAKAVWNEIRSSLIVGNNTTNPKQPNGLVNLSLREIFANGTTAGNGSALSMNALDRLLDNFIGKPDVLLASKRSRRKLAGLYRASGSGVLETQRDAFGHLVEHYAGVPFLVSDFIVDTQTVGSSADCSTIYALRLGENGFAGLTASENVVEIERIGSLESKDATRTRVKAYVAWALFDTLGASMLTGVRD